MNNVLYFLKIGGSSIKSNVSGANSLDKINTFLKRGGIAIGAILIAFAALKIIIALADENIAERQKASFLLGVGIVFVTINTVLSTLIGNGITGASDYKSIAQNVVSLIGDLGNWAGIIMLVFGAFTYVMAIAKEDASQNAKAINSILVGIGLISLGIVCDGIKSKIGGGNSDATSYISEIIKWISRMVRIGGIILVPTSVFKMVLAVRTEDSKNRDEAVKLLVIAVALVSFSTVLSFIGLR